MIIIVATVPQILYHGTDAQSAKDIEERGVDISKSHKGYFGAGFYLTPRPELAKSNYADFSGEDPEDGAVLEFILDPRANVLDLDDPEDFQEYKNSGIERLRHRDDFPQIAISKGIHGVMDMGSMEGLVIYDPSVLTLRTSSEPETQE